MRRRIRTALQFALPAALAITLTTALAAPASAAAVLVSWGSVKLNHDTGSADRSVLVDDAGGHHLAFVDFGPYLESVDLSTKKVLATRGDTEIPASGDLAVDPAKDALIVNNRLGTLTSYAEHHLGVYASRSIDQHDTRLAVDPKRHIGFAIRPCSCGHGQIDVFTVPHLYGKAPIPLFRNPVGIGYDSSNDALWVLNADSSLTIIDADTRTVGWTVPLTSHGTAVGTPVSWPSTAAAALYVGLSSGFVVPFDLKWFKPIDDPVPGSDAFRLNGPVTGLTVDPAHHLAWASDDAGDVDQVIAHVGTQSFHDPLATGLAWDGTTGLLVRVSRTHPYLEVLNPLASPEISKQPTDLHVHTGHLFILTAAADGSAPLTYRWQVSTDNGQHYTYVENSWVTAVDGAATLNDIASPDMNGRLYRAVFGNPAGLQISHPARLTVS